MDSIQIKDKQFTVSIKEQCRKLANRIYELDEKVYKTSGSGLGKTFTGEKEVNLVEFGGSQRVFGFNGLTEAQINDTTIKRSLDNAKIKGFIK